MLRCRQFGCSFDETIVFIYMYEEVSSLLIQVRNLDQANKNSPHFSNILLGGVPLYVYNIMYMHVHN